MAATLFYQNESGTPSFFGLKSPTNSLLFDVLQEAHKHVKRLTDYNIDYAYLWGDRRKDLNIKILSGPSKIKGYPSISISNTQYGKHRYVMLTNSASEAVKVEISGFPADCEAMLDIKTGNSTSLGTSIHPSIESLGVRLYKIMQ